ncbi:MAG TPA: DUF711 family protein, partial [Anaerolineales bacterium]|nr:DUF711 family protein [Anaerolineales bacterium]
MKIRSITYFCNPKYPLDEKALQKAGIFLDEARSAYEAVGYEVQTTRLATIPFPKMLGEKDIHDLPKLAEALAKAIQQVDIAYASLGPALPEIQRSYEMIPDAIAVSQNIFFGGGMAGFRDGKPSDSKVYLTAVKACAEVIVKCATIEPNGFAN